MARIEAITVPKWGLTMTEGTVVAWLVEEGQRLAVGDVLMEMETSKLLNEVESQFSGVLRRRVAQEGDTLPVAALLGVVAEPEVSETEIDAFIADFRATDVASSAEAATAAGSAVGAVTTEPQVRGGAAGSADIPASLQEGGDDSNCRATLHARKFAAEHGVNLNNVTGSGRGGRISVADIEQAIVAAGGTLPEQSAPAQAESAPGSQAAAAMAENRAERRSLSSMRRTIASRLQASKREAPHFRTVVDVDVDALLERRLALNAGLQEGRVTLTDLLVKACALTLVEVPELNIQFDGEAVHRFADADVAVAVAIDDGLITPIIRAANRKSVVDIAGEFAELSGRAREGRLRAEEFQGGTFSISNLGMFGVRQFDAIINPPQAAILAVGTVEKRMVVRDDQPAVASMMTLTLSSDHRVIDGVTAARFLAALKSLLADPARIGE